MATEYNGSNFDNVMARIKDGILNHKIYLDKVDEGTRKADTAENMRMYRYKLAQYEKLKAAMLEIMHSMIDHADAEVVRLYGLRADDPTIQEFEVLGAPAKAA